MNSNIKKKFSGKKELKKKLDSDSDSEESPQNEKETQNQIIGALDVDDDINGIFCKDSTFKSIGVCDELCEVLEKLNYKYPTKIQKETLPYALEGKDIIGLAETGSGKTFAYGIPIIQKLLDSPNFFFLCLYISTNKGIMSSNKSAFRNPWFRNRS